MAEFKNGDRVTCPSWEDGEQRWYVGPHPTAEGSAVVYRSGMGFGSYPVGDLSLVPKTYEITITLTEEEVRYRATDGIHVGPNADVNRRIDRACREALGAER